MTVQKVLELKQERAEMRDQGLAILNKAQEEGRDLTDEEREQYNGLYTKVQRSEDFEKQYLEMLSSEERDEMQSMFERQTTPDQPGESREQKGPFTADEDGFGEFLNSVMRHYSYGEHDERLSRVMEQQTRNATGQGTTVPSDGGFLVQTDHVDQLMRRVYDTGVLVPKCKTMTVGSNSDGVEMPYLDETSRVNGSRLGGIRVYRRGEADQMTASTTTFGKWECRLEDLTGLCYVTERMMQDASQIGSIIPQLFAEEFGFALDNEIIRGTGAGGQMQGIMNANAKVAVPKETGQAATTVVTENISKMWARMWPRSKGNSMWFINTDVHPELDNMSLSVGTGGSATYLPPGGLSASPYGSLKGRPVMDLEQCSTLGTEGDIILADMSQFALVRKGVMAAADSIHVRFLYNERVFRFVMRINGQSLWKSALTPFKGTDTVSPFITLADRS